LKFDNRDLLAVWQGQAHFPGRIRRGRFKRRAESSVAAAKAIQGRAASVS
jgi:hypothetical protein